MGKHKSDFAQKVAWMVEHHDLWAGWPAAHLTDEQIVDRMRGDGLVSFKVRREFGIMDFGKLVMEARAELRRRHIK